MNEKTKNILNFDPIATAETLLGKRHEDWDTKTDGMAALVLAVTTNQRKVEYLKSIGDTYFGITWIDFIEIAKAYGFKSGYFQKFTGTGRSNKGVEEEEIIFFHKEKGLILHAESYDGESVNNANVYGEVKIGDKFEKNQWEALNGALMVAMEMVQYLLMLMYEKVSFFILMLYQKFLNFLRAGLKFLSCGSLTTWTLRTKTIAMRKLISKRLMQAHLKYAKSSLDNFHSSQNTTQLYKDEWCFVFYKIISRNFIQ